MIGEIIAIGDELTSGRILNTTSYFAASQLFAAGHEVRAMITIGDDIERIGRTLQEVLSRSDFVIVTGGLGPTSDDMTNAAVSTALERPSRLYPEILRKIRQHGKGISGIAQTALEKLAWLPDGAHALHTEAKTAGYFLVHEGKPIFFLPGVPHEMKELLVETVLTRLSVWEGEEARRVRQKLYRVFGLSESEINRKLGHLEGRDARVRLGYYPVYPEVQVSLTVAARSGPEAEALFRQLDGQLTELLGTHLFAIGADTLAGVIGRQLLAKGQTIAIAESCTGGLVGQLLTKVPGSSAYFLGGVVAYSNALKERFLGVEPETLLRHGAVSPETARAMAEGIRCRTGADYALSVTGIAGPDGGSADKPVGTVYLGLAAPEKTYDFPCHFSGDRGQIQSISAYTALDLLRRRLLDYELITG
jgi:nicotinamide-nucleotide amidase